MIALALGLAIWTESLIRDPALSETPLQESPTADKSLTPDLPEPPQMRSAKDQQSSGEEALQHDILVTGRRRTPGDPLQAVNIKSFEATQAVDKAIVGPVAMTYARIVPEPVQVAVSNSLYNLHEPVVFVNYALQLKPGKAAETLGRFLLNSTLGVAGLVDVAGKKPFRLPRRPNGFADTFGFYGVKPGAFLFVPIVGATTIRDLVGTSLDRALLPFAVGTPFNKLAYSIPVGFVTTLDRRAALDEKLNEFRNAPDPYVARRDYYLRTRQDEIDRLHGRHRTEGVDTKAS